MSSRGSRHQHTRGYSYMVLLEPVSSRLTRRQMLATAGAAAVAYGAAPAGRLADRSFGQFVQPEFAPAAPGFHSRPDLRIPALAVATRPGALSPGLVLLAPYNAPAGAQAGAVIFSDRGDPVWEQPLPNLVTTDFRVQTYAGSPALTWWQGKIVLGHGVGRYVIADSSYTPLAQLNAGNGMHGDLHEFLLTDRGTALLTTYLVTRHDLRAVGGSADGSIQDAVFQELDIATGRVLLEWHSLDHIPITDSYWGLGSDWDYVHLNSIGVDGDGNLLVSSRNTHTIYKIDRVTGQIIWRLGGKHSDFAIDRQAMFAWQHDARRQPDGSISLFDNGERVSRALVLNVDETRRRVTLRRAYTHPQQLFASSQGNVQLLSNGNVFVGWGAQPYVSEFTPDGTLIFDAKLGPGYVSYRAYRAQWSGLGAGLPAVVLERAPRYTDAYVSWNGDTRVVRWTVLGGRHPSALVPIGSVPRTGFETGVRIPARFTSLRFVGSDATGRRLGASAALAR